MPNNCFENALVLCLNCFLSQIWDTFAFFFILDLSISFGCGRFSLNSHIFFLRNHFLMKLRRTHTLGLIYTVWVQPLFLKLKLP